MRRIHFSVLIFILFPAQSNAYSGWESDKAKQVEADRREIWKQLELEKQRKLAESEEARKIAAEKETRDEKKYGLSPRLEPILYNGYHGYTTLAQYSPEEELLIKQANDASKNLSDLLFRNVLLYGAAGTGKHAFAAYLAGLMSAREVELNCQGFDIPSELTSVRYQALYDKLACHHPARFERSPIVKLVVIDRLQEYIAEMPGDYSVNFARAIRTISAAIKTYHDPRNHNLLCISILSERLTPEQCARIKHLDEVYVANMSLPNVSEKISILQRWLRYHFSNDPAVATEAQLKPLVNETTTPAQLIRIGKSFKLDPVYAVLESQNNAAVVSMRESPSNQPMQPVAPDASPLAAAPSSQYLRSCTRPPWNQHFHQASQSPAPRPATQPGATVLGPNDVELVID